jgi:ubiquinone/menaquinone biosynthesis C-methylase UbiE
MFEKKLINKYGNNIHSFEISVNQSIRAHDDVKGSKIDNLEDVPFTLPFFESKYYKNKVIKYLQYICRSSTILDAGCGDGRFTLLLIEMGFKKIVSLDSNLDSLLILEEKLEELGAQEAVTLVHSSVLNLPFEKSYFDVILCVGVLYYLNSKYENGLHEIVKCLKPNSILLETEPNKEGNAIKALIFDGIERYLKVINNNLFIELFNSKEVELRCFSDEELISNYLKENLEVLECESISLLPSILTIGKMKNIISGIDGTSSQIMEIKKSFDYFDSFNGVAKHKLWVLKKV